LSISIEFNKCEEVGELVRGLALKKHGHVSASLASTDPGAGALALFYVTAICHQTRKLHNDEENLVGWDYLKNRFEKAAVADANFLSPSNLRKQSVGDVALFLQKLFSADGKPENTTLTRARERARLLIDCAAALDGKYGGSVLVLTGKSHGFLPALYAMLGEFEAYKDPLKKKSSVLIRCLSDAKLFKMADPEDFVPVVDYHMMRVLLRMGCIKPSGAKLIRELSRFRKVSSDKQFRLAAQYAFQIISRVSGKSLFELNDVFWALGRSCCHYQTQLCADKKCSKNPCTFAEVVNLPDHSHCFFETVCLGAARKEYRRLKEPNVNTSFY
jgi:hypothetical protein